MKSTSLLSYAEPTALAEVSAANRISNWKVVSYNSISDIYLQKFFTVFCFWFMAVNNCDTTYLYGNVYVRIVFLPTMLKVTLMYNPTSWIILRN